MSSWLTVISDFKGLVRALVGLRSRHMVAKTLHRDRATINRWLDGAQPSSGDDVARLIKAALENRVDISPYQSFSPIYDFSPMLTYEQKLQTGPPDLSWLTAVPLPPAIPTKLCGLETDCPLGLASSPIVSDDRWTGAMLDLGFGLSTFKTRRPTPKDSWDPPQIAFVLQPPDVLQYDPNKPPEVLVTCKWEEAKLSPVLNLVNSIGVPSEAPPEWQQVYERIKRQPRGRFVGISVMGEGEMTGSVVRDFAEAVARAKEVHPPFVELNSSCPNLEKKTGDVFDDPDLMAEICMSARDVLKGTGILLSLKLPLLAEAKLRSTLEKVGHSVDIIASRNTIRVCPMVVDRDGDRHAAFPGRRFGGLSGPCTFETTLKSIRDIDRARKDLGQEFGIIAIGGVASASDVVELLNAGANVVQACTAPMFDPLLAWKIRFHLKHSGITLHRPQDECVPLLPRDRIELDSWRNLHAAAREIRNKTGHDVPHLLACEKWNNWANSRSNPRPADAYRFSGARGVADWIRELTPRSPVRRPNRQAG